MIKLRSYPRVHVTLLDLSSKGHRLYGGIGFSIDALPIDYEIRSSPNFDLVALRNAGYSDTAVAEIERNLEKIAAPRGFSKAIHIQKISAHVRHCGLGTGTQVRMAIVEAFLLCNGVDDRNLITRLAGRGGASGVGIHTYFEGGLVLDIGRARHGTLPNFEPSNLAQGIGEMPHRLGQLLDMPWPVGIFVPKDVLPVDTSVERSFFKQHTPAPERQVHQAVYEAVFGVYGGAASADFSAFCNAINSIQRLHWKKHEIELHGTKIKAYMEEISGLGAAAVGMSSFGPCIFYFSSDTNGIAKHLKKKYADAISLSATIRRSGRSIDVE